MSRMETAHLKSVRQMWVWALPVTLADNYCGEFVPANGTNASDPISTG